MQLLFPAVVLVSGWRAALLVAMIICFITLVAVQPLRQRLDDDATPGKTTVRPIVPEASQTVAESFPVCRVASAFISVLDDLRDEVA